MMRSSIRVGSSNACFVEFDMVHGFRLVLIVALGLGALPCFGDIEVVTDEFRQAQQDEVKQIVDAVEQVASEMFGMDMSQVEDGSKIEMHLNQRDYENAVKVLNNNHPSGNDWAFVSTGDRQAHVALQPPVEREVLETTGLPLQTKVQLARVASYLCIRRAFENEASHPRWFEAGLSTQLGDQALRHMGAMGPRDDEPWTGRQFFFVRELFEEHPKYTINELFDDELKELTSTEIYYMRGTLMEWIKEVGAFDQLISQAQETEGGNNYKAQLKEKTLKALQDHGVTDPDREFKAWVGSVKPMWNQLTRSLQTTGDVWFHCAFDNTNAVCWRQEELGDRNWEISGSLRIFDGDNSQINILLGQSDAGYLSVAMGPTFGITVFHRKFIEDGKRSRWIRLDNKDVSKFEKDEWADFKITKRNNRLMIKINRERPVMIDVSEIDISGNWGLGCQNNSAGLWKNVKLER